MGQYEDFRKDVLYTLARNGGLVYLSDLVGRYKKEVEGSDALDFHLYLRRVQSEKLVERRTVNVPVEDLVLGVIPRGKAREVTELTSTGWEWVMKQRAEELVVVEESNEADEEAATALRPPVEPADSGD